MQKNITGNQQGIVHLWLIMLLVLSVVTAVGITVMKHTSAPVTNSQTAVSSDDTIKPLSTNLDTVLSTDQIKKLAATEKPDTTVSQVSLSQMVSGPVFEVEMADGTSLHFNAQTGSKVNGIKPIKNDDGQDVPASFKPAIDFAKAQQIARDQVHGSSVIRIELKSEDGNVVYQVRFSNGVRVNVNAATGAVVKQTAHSDDNAAKGKQSDDSQPQSAATPSTTSGKGNSAKSGSSSSGSISSQSSGTSGGSSTTNQSGSSNGGGSSSGGSSSSNGSNSSSGSNSGNSGSSSSGHGSSHGNQPDDNGGGQR